MTHFGTESFTKIIIFTPRIKTRGPPCWVRKSGFRSRHPFNIFYEDWCLVSQLCRHAWHHGSTFWFAHSFISFQSDDSAPTIVQMAAPTISGCRCELFRSTSGMPSCSQSLHHQWFSHVQPPGKQSINDYSTYNIIYVTYVHIFIVDKDLGQLSNDGSLSLQLARLPDAQWPLWELLQRLVSRLGEKAGWNASKKNVLTTCTCIVYIYIYILW